MQNPHNIETQPIKGINIRHLIWVIVATAGVFGSFMRIIHSQDQLAKDVTVLTNVVQEMKVTKEKEENRLRTENNLLKDKVYTQDLKILRIEIILMDKGLMAIDK